MSEQAIYKNEIHSDHQKEIFLSGDKDLASFKELAILFDEKFNLRHFPETPEKLYDASQYLLNFGGKRIRPVICLMGNQLFDEIKEAAYDVAIAIELFHNFTLVHDDIMDRAPLRRGMPTVHTKFGESTALLAGDVMLVKAYSYLNKIGNEFLHKIVDLFNKTAREVCEGQQLDMDFEDKENVDFDEYVEMITLKHLFRLPQVYKWAPSWEEPELVISNIYMNLEKTWVLPFRCRMIIWMLLAILKNLVKKPGGDIIANKKTFFYYKP